MSDPKDKSDDFTSLFEMADFDHQDDQETEDYFAKKAIEDESLDNNSYESDDSSEKTQTVIDTTFLSDDSADLDQFDEADSEEVEEIEETREPQESEDDDGFSDFSSFDEDNDDDEFGSNSEMTQVNFNPQELLGAEFEDESTDEEESIFDNDDEPEVEAFDYGKDEEPEAQLQSLSEPKEQEIPVSAIDIKKKITTTTYTQQYENFEDIQRFANTSHYSTIKSQGNPSFSIIISDIKYKEDSLKIFTILNEFGFINSDNKEIIQKSLDRGSAIISRVSEFAAFFLYHQVHLLDIKLQIGPSDLVYTSSASSHDQTGAVSSQNLLQNKEDSKKMKNEVLSSILLSTSSEIIGYSIKDFFGTCRQSLEFQAFPKVVGEETDDIETRDAFQKAHRQVEEQLKKQIQSKGGNAGVDMKVEITPLFKEEHQTYTYQVALQCHAVWIDKN